MTFNYLALKNFKSNIKKYLSIFFCCSLCVTVLNVLLNILNNEAFELLLVDKSTRTLTCISLILVIIFMVFFISYAIQIFLKSRSKEFGLYLILGMVKKDFARMIFAETGIISVASVVFGMITGTALTYMLFVLSYIVFNINNASFVFDAASLLATVLIFSLIFFIQNVLIWFKLNKLQFIEIMKQGKKSESIGMPRINSSLVLSIVAIFMLFFSFLSLYKMILDNRTNSSGGITTLVFSLVFCLIGLYLLISKTGILVIHLYKKSKQNYFNSLLVISDFCFKINQNKKIIFSATILFIMVIFLISAAYSVLADVPRVTELEQPYHIVYADFNNEVDTEKINGLINNSGVRLTEHKFIDFLYAKRINHLRNLDISSEIAIISDDQFSELSGTMVRLGEKESFQINADIGTGINNRFPYDTITLEFGDKKLDFNFRGEIKKIFLNTNLQSSKFMLVISKDDFNQIKSNIDKKYTGVFNLMNFDNWRNTQPIVAGLKEMVNSKTFTVSSRIEYYDLKLRTNILRVFLVCFVGLLFLVCISCVLYLRMISEIDQLREKFIKLFRIGMKKKEFKKIISGNLKIIFAIPFLLGAVTGIVMMYITTLNSRMESIFFLNTLIVIVAFLFFQISFYTLTQRRYNRYIFININ